MFSACRIWILFTAIAALAVVVFIPTLLCFKVIWKIALIQLRHFCIGRKLSFGQPTAICITPAYSDRLASSLGLQQQKHFHFRRGSISQQTLCWIYAVSAKTTLQIIESLRRILYSVLQSWFPFIYISVLCALCLLVFPQSVQRARCDYQFWTPSDGRQAVRFAAHSSSSRRVHNRRAWTASGDGRQAVQ